MEPGQTRLISSATLFAKDIDTPSTEVMYIFMSVPTQGLLQLKVGAIQCVAVMSFSYGFTQLIQAAKRILVS